MGNTIDKSTAERLRRCARRERRPISQVVEFAIEALLEQRAPAVAQGKILSIASLPALQVLPLTGVLQVIAFELCEKCGITSAVDTLKRKHRPCFQAARKAVRFRGDR